MSYDVYASCPHCGRSHLDGWNVTYNYSAMLSALGVHPRDWEGKSAREYAQALAGALQKLTANPDEYRQYDAPNGWGTVDQLVDKDHMPRAIREFESASEADVVRAV